jgi:hypothetical protein
VLAGEAVDASAEKEMDLSALPIKKRVIPSASLQLAPFHSEVDSTLYKQPVLIALLSTYDHKSGRTKRKPRPPRSTKKPNFEEEEEAGPFDRLVVKVYDVTGSAEYLHTLIIREYELLLEDLDEAYHCRAHVYFQPTKPAWWATHIKSILVIESQPKNKMKLKISRKAIEQLVAEGVESGVPPKPLMKLKDLTAPPKIASPGATSPLPSPGKSKPIASLSPPRARVTASAGDAAPTSKPPLAKKAPQPVGLSAVKAGSTGASKPLKVVSSKVEPAAKLEAGSNAKVVKPTSVVTSSTKNASQNATAGRSASPASAQRGSNTKAAPVSATGSTKTSASAKAGVKSAASTATSQKPRGAADGASATAVPAATTAAKQDPQQLPVSEVAADAIEAVEGGGINDPAEDGEYNEDFENGSQIEVAGAPASSAVASRGGDSVKKPGTAGEYDEDFEEEASAAGTAGTAGTADDANTAHTVNTTGAVASTAADTHTSTQDGSVLDGTRLDGLNISEPSQRGGMNPIPQDGEAQNRYYSDFEDNSVDNASRAVVDDPSYADDPDFADSSAPRGSVSNHEHNGVNANERGAVAPRGEGDRPLSAIEQAQREFDEIGEDDGVFFNSVDYDEEF